MPTRGSVVKRWCGAIVLLGGLAAGCSLQEATPKHVADPADSVETALVHWYDAVSARDSAAIIEGMAPDFLLVRDTTLMTRDVLMKHFMDSRGKGRQSSQLSDFHTVVSHSTAWTTVRNHETWVPADGKDSLRFDFIETVVLRRHDGRWRMERYHATPLKR